MEKFEPKKFVEKQIKEIQKAIGTKKALIAVSGGVDSVTSAVLTHLAIGENLLCVMLDDAFMRENEPQQVAQTLSKPPLNIPLKILDARERFLKAFKGLRDAEEKRKVFRETFYNVLAETARKENCSFLVQGTIKADIVETAGGIKTQHNVLSQIGINSFEKFGFKIIEPLMELYKEQVRIVARHLGIPPEISERQPFPGPGLSVRVVGEIKIDKLKTLKKATTIVEKHLSKHNPSQYFAAIIENEDDVLLSHEVLNLRETVAHLLNVPSRNVHVKAFRDKATGIESGKRRYGQVLLVKVQTTHGEIHKSKISDLIALQKKIITTNPSFTRVLYTIEEKTPKKPYTIIVRAIQTRDFLTADVMNIPWETQKSIAEEILRQCPKVSCVCYDITPKPPATIEME
jgi:GMP synthase (glutamine-hydrolysing)